MTESFPDTTSVRNGAPTELTTREARRGPSLPVLCALLTLALLALLCAISEVLAADLPRESRARWADFHPAALRTARVDPASLSAPAERLLAEENAALGEVRVEISPPDSRLDLAACEQLQAFLPPGARPQGHTTVGVRCQRPSRWTVYLQAQVQVLGPYLVAARPLAAGQLLGPADVALRSGDLAELPGGTLSDLEAALGRPLAVAVNTGQPLRRDYLKSIPVVQSGQPVRLLVLGHGFQVSGDGTAVANAGDGQTVQVRTPRGTVVSGVARPGGVVELRL
jgi:flagella basal body P-ring formation protein FlgA